MILLQSKEGIVDRAFGVSTDPATSFLIGFLVILLILAFYTLRHIYHENRATNKEYRERIIASSIEMTKVVQQNTQINDKVNDSLIRNTDAIENNTELIRKLGLYPRQ